MKESSTSTKRYPWFFLDPSSAWRNSLLFTLLMGGLGIAAFFIYNRMSTDLSPDSIAGYSFATLGTLCLFLAALSYTLKRRSRKRRVGELNGSLHWHVSFGVLAMVLLLLHSFGHFNPRSGTYALYGMIALVISGIIGRLLDRIAPRLITQEASKALTASGEDRIEALSHNVRAIVEYNAQQVRSFSTPKVDRHQSTSAQPAVSARSQPRPGAPLPGSWDLAYLSLEETPQEVERDNPQYRFIPDRKSNFTRPGALMPGLEEQVSELQNLQQVLQREHFYRALIRYWRVFHICLVILTIALLLWHLEFASQLLITAAFHR